MSETAARLDRVPDALLASGPGLVGAAYGLDRGWTGTDLCDPRSALRLERPASAAGSDPVVAGPRVGIAYAGEPWTRMPWRLMLAGSPSLSRPHPRPAATRS